MRILVLSDSHGDLHSVLNIVSAQKKAEVIIHCGDGEAESTYLRNHFPDKAVFNVRGNCDFSSTANDTEMLNLGGKKIMVTHGHRYSVKSGIMSLCYAAREAKADIVLFGHTHNALNEYADGLYIMNPGSCHGWGASYGYIDITDDGGILTNIVHL